MESLCYPILLFEFAELTLDHQLSHLTGRELRLSDLLEVPRELDGLRFLKIGIGEDVRGNNQGLTVSAERSVTWDKRLLPLGMVNPTSANSSTSI